MRTIIALFIAICFATTSFAQPKANYQMAAKFSSKKLDKMLFSLNVDPHWLKNLIGFGTHIKQLMAKNGIS
jgi:hypothetical protein